MQIKTTIKFHFFTHQIGKIKKLDSLHWWWGGGETGTAIHYWWIWKVVQPFWRKIWEYLTISNPVSTQNSLCEFILNTYLQQYENIYAQLFTEYLPLSSIRDGLKKLWYKRTMQLWSGVLCTDMKWFLGDIINEKGKMQKKICYANFYVQNKGKF